MFGRKQIMEKNALILDTSAFIAGFDPLAHSEKQYTAPKVKNELNTASISWIRYNAAIENRKLIILNPEDSVFQKVLEESKKAGDIRYLSEADLQVLAIAMELKNRGLNPVIITDDYSIQNVANKMKIKFKSLMTFGIKFRFKWILYCPACYKKYPSDYNFKSCEICGTVLKRKPKKKSNL